MAVKLFAARLAPHNVPVFEIEPGVIRTDMIASVAAAYEQRIADGLLPQRRLGEPKDVAKAVRAIADGQLDYSTGQVLYVDGGGAAGLPNRNCYRAQAPPDPEVGGLRNFFLFLSSRRSR